MKKIYLKFTIAAVVMQLLLWAVFCLYDYEIDEGRIRIHYILRYIVDFLLLFALPAVPAVLYLKNEKLFSTGERIKDTAIHCIIWTAVSALISLPLWDAVNYDHWFIHQRRIMFNGMEYLIFAITSAAGFVLLTPLIMGIRHFVRKKRGA